MVHISLSLNAQWQMTSLPSLFVVGTLDRYFKTLVNGKVYDFLQRRMPSKTISFFNSAKVEGKDSLGPIR